MNKKFPRALLPLTALAVASTVAACGHDEPAADPPAPPPAVSVELATAELSLDARTPPAVGSVRARRQVSPGTKILGRVDAITVREGERVGRDGLLARLESRDLEAAVATADAAVTMAEAQLENATAQRDRMQQLAGRGSATAKNLEDAVAAFRVAAAGLAQAKAGLAAAEVTLSYAEVRSPLAGWVVERLIEAGDMASPGRPLFVIEDLSSVEVEVRVPEAQVVDLTPGQEARVLVLDQDRVARISRIAPSGDATSRTFLVKLELANPDGRLRSGMFARVVFAGGGDRQQLTVERSAVLRRGQLDGLFVLDAGGLLRLRWVKLGRLDGERVEVLSGLDVGERYVVAAPAGLVDGTPYRGGVS